MRVPAAPDPRFVPSCLEGELCLPQATQVFGPNTAGRSHRYLLTSELAFLWLISQQWENPIGLRPRPGLCVSFSA